jgi:peptide/nickel transport system permease protein
VSTTGPLPPTPGAAPAGPPTGPSTVPPTVPARDASPTSGSIVRRQFGKHRLAMWSLCLLGALYVAALGADFIAPYGEGQSFRRGEENRSYAPPTTIYWHDPETGRLTRPFVYPVRAQRDPVSLRVAYVEDTARPTPIRFFVEGHRYVPVPLSFVPEDWRQRLGIDDVRVGWHLFGVEFPATIYLWGADQFGRDVFGRILFGARISLTIGIFASLVALGLGMALGAVAGYYGGVVDDVVMRLVEVIATIPTLFLLLALRALFPLEIDPTAIFVILVTILGFISWGSIARVVRGMALSLREEEYVVAAKALGSRDVRVMVRHLLPGTFAYAIVSFSLLVPGFILTEAGLSFLGLGISEPASSWGLMLAVAQEGGIQTFTQGPWMLVPGLFIFIAVLAYNFVGDGLRDALDPKLRK